MRFVSGALYVFATLLALWGISACSPKIFKVDSTEYIRETLFYLASDELEGRKSGEKGDSLAALFIKEKMRESKLRLLYNDGFQSFSMISSVKLGPSNQLGYNGMTFEVNRDYLPYSFSSTASFTGEVVFAGYGFDIQTDTLKWNDFGTVDVAGKWVLLLKGDPEPEKSESVFEPYSDVRAKVLAALDHKASGVLLVGGPKYTEKDQLQDLFYDKNSSSYPVPVFQITRDVADKILASEQQSIEKLESQMIAIRRPASFKLDGLVNGTADVIPQNVKSNNVVAIVEGNDGRLRNEYVVIGAHYDHLGWGGPGSGSRATDTVGIHYGADDNASGVALMLELARKASQEKELRRSILFAAFGAEEMGLIGSKALVANPPVDLKKVKAMFNFDMVGRLDTAARGLSIGGTLTSKESESILSRLNRDFSLAFSGDGVGPSDHAAFYVSNIPVFFFSTGAHADYHTPGDSAGAVHFSGISQIADYAWKVIKEVANRDSSLTFQEAGSKMQRSRGGRFKVTLGVMPDYAGLEKAGMRVDAVTKGKPAEKAGMQKGDIITAIDGKPVGNIYDYMNRLQTLAEGQTISVDIIREGKHLVLIVQL